MVEFPLQLLEGVVRTITRYLTLLIAPVPRVLLRVLSNWGNVLCLILEDEVDRVAALVGGDLAVASLLSPGSELACLVRTAI